jgi:hypothetical protein
MTPPPNPFRPGPFLTESAESRPAVKKPHHEAHKETEAKIPPPCPTAAGLAGGSQEELIRRTNDCVEKRGSHSTLLLIRWQPFARGPSLPAFDHVFGQVPARYEIRAAERDVAVDARVHAARRNACRVGI